MNLLSDKNVEYLKLAKPGGTSNPFLDITRSALSYLLLLLPIGQTLKIGEDIQAGISNGADPET